LNGGTGKSHVTQTIDIEKKILHQLFKTINQKSTTPYNLKTAAGSEGVSTKSCGSQEAVNPESTSDKKVVPTPPETRSLAVTCRMPVYSNCT
jgi:hypothetical protein